MTDCSSVKPICSEHHNCNKKQQTIHGGLPTSVSAPFFLAKKTKLLLMNEWMNVTKIHSVLRISFTVRQLMKHIFRITKSEDTEYINKKHIWKNPVFFPVSETAFQNRSPRAISFQGQLKCYYDENIASRFFHRLIVYVKKSLLAKF